MRKEDRTDTKLKRSHAPWRAIIVPHETAMNESTQAGRGIESTSLSLWRKELERNPEVRSGAPSHFAHAQPKRVCVLQLTPVGCGEDQNPGAPSRRNACTDWLSRYYVV
jgi:hypothetical protein